MTEMEGAKKKTGSGAVAGEQKVRDAERHDGRTAFNPICEQW